MYGTANSTREFDMIANYNQVAKAKKKRFLHVEKDVRGRYLETTGL